jgi:hypothetical protein
VTAVFVEEWALTISASPALGGTITPPAGVHVYDDGTVVPLSAVAASGYTFDHWLGNVADPNAASTTITLHADEVVTAVFIADSGPTECVVDNKDDLSDCYFEVVFGTWKTNDGGSHRWDPADPASDYRYCTAQSGSETARAEWACTTLPAGTYEVFAWWPVFTYSMGQNVAYEVHHVGGPTTVRKDQNADGGQWNSLGVYTFNASSHIVQIHNGAAVPGKYVVADAVKFVQTAPPETGSLQVMLEPEAARTAGAQWCVDAGAWQDSGTTIGDLAVGAHTVEYKAVVGHAAPPTEQVTIVADTTTSITRTYTESSDSIVDNKDAGFSVSSGTWNTNNGGAQRWDPSDPTSDYRYCRAQSGGETARAEWACTTLPAGTYEVFAWWPVFTYSMGENVAYEVHHVGGTTTVRKDQNVDGGQWNSLGIFTFSASSHIVQIHNGAAQPGSYVVADAVKFVQTVPPETGSLQVTLEPEAARTAGAQWRVDAGAWQDSGATVGDLAVGLHTVEYKPVAGLGAPPTEQVTITADTTTSITRTYTEATESIVDNKDAGFSVSSGTWNTNNGGAQRWDPSDPTSDYRYCRAQSGGETARAEWACTTLPAGTYEVFAWWPVFTYSMGQNVGYEVHHVGGSTTVRKDQNVDGGQWNSLGVYTFSASLHIVQIHNGAAQPGSYVVADAVKFVQTAPPETGSLQVTLEPEAARTAGAQWCVDAGAWQDSGTTIGDLAVGAHTVEYKAVLGLASPPTEQVTIVADTTTSITRTYTEATESVVDNKDAGFSVSSGTWKTNDGGTHRWDPSDPTSNYRYCTAQSGGETARAEWTCTTLPAGTYEVFAWWPVFTYSMGENVAYEVHHVGGPTTVRKDQNADGGQWNSLGVYTFNASSHVVRIHNGAAVPGKYVVADAVKFVKAP